VLRTGLNIGHNCGSVKEIRQFFHVTLGCTGPPV
jgi:hypothetical protein